MNKSEIKKAIHFQRPVRPPVVDGLPFPYETRERRKNLLERFPDDAVSTNITVSYWDAPEGFPDYRFAMRGMERPERICRDSFPVIRDWDSLDEFLEQFPGNFHKPSYDKVAGLRQDNPDKYIRVSFGHYLFWRLAELRGLQNFLVDIYENPDKLRTVMDKLLEMYAMWAVKMKEAGADGIHGGEDIGTQRSLFCNPDMFRTLFKPAYARLGEILHSNGLDYWLHSCGNVTEIMEDLIDAGVDVIHPIQVGAMDARSVLGKYRGRICFHVGMDVQDLIPKGPPEYIKREIQKRMELFYNETGGVIYGAGNVLTDDIPVENILAYRNTMEIFTRGKSL